MGCFFSQPYALLGWWSVNAQELKTPEWMFWYPLLGNVMVMYVNMA